MLIKVFLCIHESNLLQIANMEEIYLFQMDNGGKVLTDDKREWIAMNKALEADNSVRLL